MNTPRAAQAATRVVPKGLSSLEAATIKGSTHQDYERRVLRFTEWARAAGLDWESFTVLDEMLCEYFDHRFFAGGTAEAAKVLAGLAYFDPRLNGMVPSMLPRASRGLRGWTKIGPADQ